MTDPAYSGPCFCRAPGVFDPIQIDIPASGALVANQSTTIRWNSARNATYLELDLYMYTGICTLTPMSSSRTFFSTYKSCTFSQLLDTMRFNDTGEAQWTPGAAGYALESRNDYVFSGLLVFRETKEGHLIGSEQFAIVKAEGEQPMKLPSLDDIESSLVATVSMSSSSRRSLPTATTTSGSTMGVPTISGPLVTQTGRAESLNGAVVNWKLSLVLGGLLLSIF